MEQIVTEQIEKFQSGDFSGYESFYYATSQTVYTMLHTIIPDENTAAELMPKVYEKIYANVQALPQTEAFYAWSAKLANEEVLEYLKENAVSTGNSDMQPEMDSVNAQTVESADSGLDMPFYDYAAEDEALAITEELSENRVFAEQVQAVIEALSPMEKIVFQSYYYFGESVPMIVEKTGCTTRAVKRTLGQTRTAMLSAVSELAQAPAYAVQQENSHKFSLKDTPWLYILFQNYIGKVTGIAHVGITGSAAGAIAMVGQAGGVAGTSAVMGQAGGIAGTTAGQAGSAAGTAVTGQAGGAAGAAAKASAHGIAKFLGTVGGKVAVGVAGAATVVGIGLGIHHASSEPERHIVAIEEEDGNGALMWEDGPAPVQEATTEEISWVDLKLEETRQNVDSYRTTGSGTRGDDAEVGESLAPYERKNCFYAVEDINGDGMEDIYFGYWNSETRQIEIRHTYERDDIDGIVTYYQKDLYLSDQAKEFLYDKVDSRFELISDYMDNDVGYLKIDTGGGEKYYKVIATTWYVHGGSDGTVNYDNYDYDFLLRQMRDENYSGYYQEVSASEFETYKASFTYKKLEWHPLFEDETILNEDPSIPDADGKF